MDHHCSSSSDKGAGGRKGGREGGRGGGGGGGGEGEREGGGSMSLVWIITAIPNLTKREGGRD